MLAGTSTGGIIALGLAGGKTVDELISLYRDNGEAIFDDFQLKAAPPEVAADGGRLLWDLYAPVAGW